MFTVAIFLGWWWRLLGVPDVRPTLDTALINLALGLLLSTAGPAVRDSPAMADFASPVAQSVVGLVHVQFDVPEHLANALLAVVVLAAPGEVPFASFAFDRVAVVEIEDFLSKEKEQRSNAYTLLLFLGSLPQRVPWESIQTRYSLVLAGSLYPNQRKVHPIPLHVDLQQ
jgi:hypothetical protein